MHALRDIAPHVPLRVKLFRTSVVKMACEGATSTALLFILASGMADYTSASAAGDPPASRAAEMRRFAYFCLCATTLAIGHVLFLLLMPDATWGRVQLLARKAVKSAAWRLSAITSLQVGSLAAAGGSSTLQVMLSQVAPEECPAACTSVATGAGRGRVHACAVMKQSAEEVEGLAVPPAPRVRMRRTRSGGARCL